MGKRANGEGTVRQRPDGTWEARFQYEDSVTGQIMRPSFYGKTDKIARQKMKDAMTRVEQGMPATDAAITVSAWVDRWIVTALAASPRAESTKVLSESLLRNHVQSATIGAVQLRRLRPTHIDALVLELRARTHEKLRGGESVQVRALSDASIQRVFTALRSCLNDAVRDGLLGVNPAQKVKQPTAAPKEARYLTPDELSAFMNACEGTRYKNLFVFIAGTGLRKGEALAIMWRDIDFTAGTVTVRGTLQRLRGKLVVSEPKTRKSRRVLAPSDRVMRVLKEQHTHQVTERLKAGSAWEGSDFVFTTESGGPVDPRNALRAFDMAANKAGIKDACIHSLRHSMATTLLDNGVHLKAVSELLGHARIQITADTYAHLTTATARRAMDTLGEVMGL